MQRRQVFFVSDSTGITVETLGRSLLTQFADLEFETRVLRYIDTQEKAQQLATAIKQAAQASEVQPIIFSTLIDPGAQKIVAASGGLFLDFMSTFIAPLEKVWGTTRTPKVGHGHGMVLEGQYSQRMEAVNFAMQNDDGGSIRHYDRADVVLIGVSRCGKTPTCLYLALHYGVFAANYPLLEEELEDMRLPRDLQAFRDKLFGLSIKPERLHYIRRQRKPDSHYASLRQCQYEVRQSEALFRSNSIPHLDVSSMSVEEIATSIIHAGLLPDV